MENKLTTVAVIPARMGSTRFPGKPLELIKGKPMIWHVWKRSMLSEALDVVVIATCDAAIRDEAESFGAQVVMTSDQHTRSNDRVAEAAESIDGDIIFNIQGDEPLVNPRMIGDVVEAFRGNPDIQCVNPVAPIEDADELASPNTVKVTFDLFGRVLYFSRYPIPSDWMNKRTGPVYRQVPILAFRRDFLFELSALPEGPLEIQESVDLMRALENGLPINVLKTSFQTIGVDVPEDIVRVERFLDTDPVHELYGVGGQK